MPVDAQVHDQTIALRDPMTGGRLLARVFDLNGGAELLLTDM